MITSFLLALQFLTVIPIKIKHIYEKQISRSVVYFPLIGLLLGLILAGTNNLLLILNFAPLIISIILVILLAALTGGIHLDGLADTFDAFSCRKNKEEMLAIMRDSHIGVMGVLSLVSIILLKIAFLYSVSTRLKIISLFLMCTLSRWSLVLTMFLFPYAREEGKAKVFIKGVNFRIFILSTIITIVGTLALWRIKGLLIFIIVAMGSYIIGKFITNKIGGMTGDTLGAVNELMEALILFGVCVIERSGVWII